MELSEGIRRIGFRRWYERQLIESHLYLISGFLCLITVLASAEEFSIRTPVWETILRLAAILAGCALCLWTVRRYLMMLGTAEYAAERSVCEKCAAYRGLELISFGARGATLHGEEDEDTVLTVGVRCRQCGHEWTIE